MTTSTKWATAIIFLVIYGLAVFLATRAYYSTAPEVAATADGGLPAERPETGARLRPLNLPATGDDPASVLEQADAAFQSRDYASAARGYARVLELAPDNVEIYNNLGLTLYYLGRTDEALDSLNRGIAIDPQVQRIWLTLGFVQSNAQRTEAARRSLQKAIELGADTPIGREARRLLDSLPR